MFFFHHRSLPHLCILPLLFPTEIITNNLACLQIGSTRLLLLRITCLKTVILEYAAQQ